MKLSEVDGTTPSATEAPSTEPSGAETPRRGVKLSQLGPQQPSNVPGGAVGAFFRSMATGLADVYKGAEGVGVKMVSGLAGAGPEWSQLHEQQMQQRDRDIAQSPSVQAHPTASGLGRFAGQTVGTAPLGAIPGAGALPMAGRIGASALQGATGAGVLSGGSPTQMAVGGALGAVPGAVAGAIGPRIDPAFQAIQQAYPDLARMATGALGRTKEAFQTATANFALRPIGEALTRGTKAGKDLLDQVGDKVSAAYDAVVPHLSFNANAPNQAGTSFATGLPNLRAKVPTAHEKDFDKLIDQQITSKLDPNGNLSGQLWKHADSVLGDKANRYLKGNANPDQQEFGRVLRELQEDMRDTLASQNPQLAPALQKADQAWSRYVQMQQASGRKIADDFFDPADILYAARGNIGTRRFAQSESEMKAFGRAGDDLVNGRAPAWRKYFPESIGGLVGGTAGAAVGHKLGGPIGGIIGGGAGIAAGTGAGHLAARARQLPAARAAGHLVERGGGAAAGAAGGRRDTLEMVEPYVGTSGM